MSERIRSKLFDSARLPQALVTFAAILCCSLMSPLMAAEPEPSDKPHTVTESFNQLANSIEMSQQWNATNATEHEA